MKLFTQEKPRALIRIKQAEKLQPAKENGGPFGPP